ncbi:hypothetical protein HYFRA_00012740 [Hymenoscyphus fraxineus]|uniref:Rhodopsin domain-containing protein n=1 Tax=Hymenoscyphus fraxineus TaxID=746836 RepID=A0A9N9LB26_9HELO|nr:hypothetical protein HYFRA_00012740 [Hymenoscyphus fraxineus]
MNDDTQLVITDTNKSPLVQIIVWLLLSTSVLTVLVRIATKTLYVRKIEADDILILVAVILAIGQSIAVLVSTNYGFGQQINTLHDSQIEALTKSQYAGNILGTAVLSLIKLSVLSFIKSLTAVSLHRHLATGLQVVITIWAVSAAFAIAFLCGVPAPWNYFHKPSSCLDHRRRFWTYHGAMNIVTETGQILLILGIISHLHVPRKRRMNLCLIFGARILWAP